MAFFGGEIPEEIKAMILKHMDHTTMAATTTFHDFQRLFAEMTPEHLRSIMLIFRYIASEGSVPASYFEGLASGSLMYKHNICCSCFVNHEEELQEHLVEANPEESADPSREGLLKTYRLEPSLSTDLLICTGCGMSYQSLEDRMLKPPDNCSGCHEKARWG